MLMAMATARTISKQFSKRQPLKIAEVVLKTPAISVPPIALSDYDTGRQRAGFANFAWLSGAVLKVEKRSAPFS